MGPLDKALTCVDRLLQVFDGLLLAGVIAALLVIEPAKLLKNLGVVGITVKNAPISCLGRLELNQLLEQTGKFE